RIDKLKDKQRKALLEYVQDPISTTCLILTCDDKKQAKKLTSFKKFASFKDFPLLKPAELTSWISGMFQKSGIKAGFGQCKMLAEFVGSDLQALASEIEKLSLFIHDRENKTVTQEDILECVGFTKEENPFRLNNSILYCKKTDALEAIDNLINGGETPFAILSQTYNALKTLFKIRLMKDSGFYNEQEIFNASGLRFDNQKSIIRGSVPSATALGKAFKKIIEVEKTLKSSSVEKPAIMLKSIILIGLSKK
ncbi:MAG: DNA polymerase III subunit delta, partial [Elusimicrobiaceae bacterium]|nr:DNA polymerase III subunit delta [Elusimicrobiaceae bacterium]